MRSPRVYLPNPLNAGATLDLPAEAVRHLVKVLRIRPEQILRLFNGDGREYHARIVNLSKTQLKAEIVEVIQPGNESPLDLTLIQGLSKGEKMEFTIQKAVELGVQRIWPTIMERSVVRLNAERMEKKQAHWQRVANSASEQCGRCLLTDISTTRRFTKVLDDGADFIGISLDPCAKTRLSELPRPDLPVRILVGPEGGLSAAELEYAQENGYKGVSLGLRVLRTETAGLAVVSAMQALWGDM